MINPRERMTARMNRARLKLEVRRAVRPLAVVLVGATLGLTAWLIHLFEVGEHVVRGSTELRFAVDDASAVVPHRQGVRFKGIPAGTITDVELEDGEQPVLTVRVLDEYAPIYRDARATLRPNTALEDMYLDIRDRGSAESGEATSDEPIPAHQTDITVQIEDVLQVFDEDTRTHMGALLRDLGGGLEDRGDDLREAFVQVVPFVQVASRMTDQLAERSKRTRRLVSNFSILTEELARRDGELRTLTGEGGKTLRTLANASPALDATLRELPPTLSELDASFAAVRGVLPDLDEALRSLGPVADRLPEGLAALRGLSDTADPAVRALREPVRRLVPLARALRPFSSDLARAIGAMRPHTGAIDHITESTSGCVFPGLYGFFKWDASLAKFEDAYGVYPRGDAIFGFGSNPVVEDPDLGVQQGCARGLPKVAGPREVSGR